MTTPEMQLRPMLSNLHAHLREQLDSVLSPACDPDAGIWTRWAAVRLLEDELRPCLQAERELAGAVGQRLGRPAAEHLWTTGELLHALALRLAELGRMPRSCPEFVSTAAKYRLAFDYWCRDVEAFVGALSRAMAPPELVARVELLEQGRAVTA
jgi:hypothetical protein